MTKYYVNKNAQDDGYHEIHAENCVFLPLITNREELGDFPMCELAMIKAKKYYDKVDGCFYCAKSCHKR